MLFYTNSTERLRISSDGYLGIGVDPNKPLHIYTGSSDSEIRLQTNSGTEQNSYITLRQSNGDLDFYTVQAGTKMKFHTANTERMHITGKGDLNIKSNDKGWVTIEHGYNGRGMKRHYREFNTGSSAATYNLIRVRRHYWGWGHYKFTVKRVYYSGILDSVFYLNGHGRDDGSYNPSYVITQRQYGGDGSNFGYSNRIQITSPSTSSPGDSNAAYADVQLNCPAYMYFQVEVEAYASAYSTDVSSLASDQYALHS